MDSETPYLSVVVTARNDGHGGNLLGRMQIFVNAWLAQCRRHGLSSELIVVEWNPPHDRPSLMEALHWPPQLGPCTVRFIVVPPELHRRYAHADALPLYQMIAKNIGIRRARGRFVLATNIDIIFNNELIERFAAGALQPGVVYRIDRHDVMSDVPVEATIEEQLAYCRAHLIRVNTREGTFRLTPDGLRALEAQDVASADSGITFGSGWFGIEHQSARQVFRWAGNDAEVRVIPRSDPPLPLRFDVEPGTGVGGRVFRLQVVDEAGKVVATTVVRGRSIVTVQFPSAVRRFWFRAVDGGRPTPLDPRTLNFRIFRCEWDTQSELRSTDGQYCLTAASEPLGILPLRVSNVHLRRMIRCYRDTGSLRQATIAVARHLLRSRQFAVSVVDGEDVFQQGSGIRPGRGWYPLENWLGESFRWACKDAEIIICAGDDISRKLLLQIESGPGVDFRPFELLVRDQKGETVCRLPVRRIELVEISLPLEPGATHVFTLSLDGGDRPSPDDPRILNFRVFWCGWSLKQIDGAEDQTEDQADDAIRGGNTAICPVFLHTNACGDFTLMAREHWFDLRGYAEFDMYSMNLDSLLCYAAHHAGLREEIFQAPMQVYHIEHGLGSGWTPEGEAQLYARLAAKGVGYLSYQELVRMAMEMRRLNRPMIFNGENWGLADCELRETSPAGGISAHGGN